MGLTGAAVAGCAVGAGILLVIVGLIPTVEQPRTRTAEQGRVTRWWKNQTPRWRWWAVAAMVLGIVVAVVSGWLAALVVIPAVLLVLPWLLSAPPNREVDLLAALDRWVRLVGTSITSGRSIRDAFFATRRQAPPLLEGAVTRLCTRLDQRWTIKDALLAMADELESADADAVIAAMVVASARGGGGVKATLDALSNTIQDRLRALREISAERAKPRAVARQVTVITLGVLGAALLFNSPYFVPYTTPIGQLLALGITTAYLSCLIILRRMTVPKMAPRFLRNAP